MRPLLVVFERVARDCSLSATGQGRGTWRIGFDSLGDAISTAALQRSRGRSRCRVIASLSSSRIQYCGDRNGSNSCGSAVIIRDVLQGVHPGRLAILVTYSGWSLAFVGAGMIVSVTVWPETLLVGLPFIAFGLWVASRGVARSGD